MEPYEDTSHLMNGSRTTPDQTFPVILTISQLPQMIDSTEVRSATQLGSGERILITHKEIAEILGLSHDFVMAALRRGDIPARKVGGRWIISRVTFFRWLDGQ